MLNIVTNDAQNSATFDVSQRYRYHLSRHFGSSQENAKPSVVFIMLNPSSADTEQNDPTIRACSQFAQSWGYSHLEVVNLFAYRTKNPSELALTLDPIGPDNDRYLLTTVKAADQIIVAWGNKGNLHNRSNYVLTLLTEYQNKVFYFKRNISGQPAHPLYIKRQTSLKYWFNHPYVP